MQQHVKQDSGFFERCFYPSGTTIVHEGDRGETAYYVESGSVRIFTDINGKKLELARMEKGQLFGEMALLYGEPRSASVETLEDCTLIAITSEAFHEKLNECDGMIKILIHMLAERVNKNNEQIRNNIYSFEEAAHARLNTILDGLPATEKDAFRQDVLPHFSELLDKLDAYKKNSILS